MSNGVKHFKKVVATLLTLTFVIGLLAACSKPAEKPSNEKRVLRIGMEYGSTEDSYFRQQYTDAFELSTGIEVQLVPAINYDDRRFEEYDPQTGMPVNQPDPYEEMKKLLTGPNPVDVVMLDYNKLKRMVQDNLLQQLDPHIEKDRFDISDIVPTVIDGIKQAGDNNIYALSPTFYSSALFFNKKLFDAKSLPHPTDAMEWGDVLNLARQLSEGEGADRTFGFSFNRWNSGAFSDASAYSQALQLKMWDDKGEKMLVNSQQWKDVWETIAGLYSNKIVPDNEAMNLFYEKMQGENDNGDVYNPYSHDLFMSGKIAMTIGDYYYVNELRSASQYAEQGKGFDMIDWDVVTVPVHPSNPEVGGNIYLTTLTAINAQAQNVDDAWKFVQFINGKDWARIKSRSQNEMVSRKEFLQPIGGMNYNIDAFTKLRPLPPVSSDADEKLYRAKPGIHRAQEFGYQLMEEVVKGDKSVDQALQEWETKGNAMLKELETNPNGPIDDNNFGALTPEKRALMIASGVDILEDEGQSSTEEEVVSE